MEYRVYWIPQIPMDAFYVSVSNPLEGRRLLDILAQYDLFQLEHNIKPDYSNAGGLEVIEDGEWVDWHDPEFDEDIDSFVLDKDHLGRLVLLRKEFV